MSEQCCSVYEDEIIKLKKQLREVLGLLYIAVRNSEKELRIPFESMYALDYANDEIEISKDLKSLEWVVRVSNTSEDK